MAPNVQQSRTHLTTLFSSCFYPMLIFNIRFLAVDNIKLSSKLIMSIYFFLDFFKKQKVIRDGKRLNNFVYKFLKSNFD